MLLRTVAWCQKCITTAVMHFWWCWWMLKDAATLSSENVTRNFIKNPLAQAGCCLVQPPPPPNKKVRHLMWEPFPDSTVFAAHWWTYVHNNSKPAHCCMLLATKQESDEMCIVNVPMKASACHRPWGGGEWYLLLLIVRPLFHGFASEPRLHISVNSAVKVAT